MAKDQKSTDCRALMEAEVKEHSALWNRSPRFRAAVEARTKNTPAPRKVTGKR